MRPCFPTCGPRIISIRCWPRFRSIKSEFQWSGIHESTVLTSIRGYSEGQWILRCTALTALTSPKEKVTQPLFLPRHLAEGSCWNGHLGSGRDMVTLGLQCKGHPACLGGRPLAGCCRAVRVPRTCGLEKCPEAINKHWKGWECTLNNEPCLLSMRTLASLG